MHISADPSGGERVREHCCIRRAERNAQLGSVFARKTCMFTGGQHCTIRDIEDTTRTMDTGRISGRRSCKYAGYVHDCNILAKAVITRDAFGWGR